MEQIVYAYLVVLFLSAASFSEALNPEYLDMLLMTEKYEKFAELTGLSVDLVKPGDGRSGNPMFNEGLFEGDIIPNPRERQNVKFEEYPGSKWQGGEVPYHISFLFLLNRRRVQAGIDEWNKQLGNCIKWVPHRNQTDYVIFFPLFGCFSSLGKVGGPQLISLQMPGCLSKGTVVHEMEHAVGFSHEHNREDRDNFVRVLYENIPPQWQSQYQKNDPTLFGLTGPYDYYSVMHYPYLAPDTRRPAFDILTPGINETRLGQTDGFTEIDIMKIQSQYCTNSTRR